jgi:hypothetical protein
MKLESGTSLRIIENKKVICNNCIISEPFTEDEILCNLEPEQKRKRIGSFCSHGQWIMEGEIYPFDYAFAIAYRSGDIQTDKDIGEE